MPLKRKPKQIRWTVPCGNDREGMERLSRWKTAARLIQQNTPHRFSAWIREILDAASERILKNDRRN
jgi:hypothetical protein